MTLSIALCGSRAIFSVTVDGFSTFHFECLVLLSEVYIEYSTYELIIVLIRALCSTSLQIFILPQLEIVSLPMVQKLFAQLVSAPRRESLQVAKDDFHL